MILVDANLLLYAKITDFPQHPAATDWLEARLNGPTRVGLPWPSLLAFLRLSTNGRIFPRPLAMGASWDQVEEWLALEPVWVPGPTEHHAATLAGLVREATPGPKVVPDAHLAALAMEHGLVLCTTDRGFARFEGLRWEDPLDQGGPRIG